MEEKQFLESLRPNNLSEFIGQEDIKESLGLFIEAANQRSEALDHVLFYGNPGLGKTTLATIISKEIDTKVVITNGAIIRKASDLITTLIEMKEREILFIDEIHRLPNAVEEYLYTVLEDSAIDLLCDDEESGKPVATRIPLEKFTVVGATTRAGMITAPLRNRFGIDFNLENYSIVNLSFIALRSAKLLNTKINKDAAELISHGSRGTPRLVNNLLKRCRDYAQVKGKTEIDLESVQATFKLLQIDNIGLNKMDRSVMKVIIDNHNGGPVGIKTLALGVGESTEIIETINEPFLVLNGFLSITSRGRKATEKAQLYFG